MFLLMILWLKVLSPNIVLKCWLVFLAQDGHVEKIPVLDKFHSGMRYSDVGHEFRVNESRMDFK
jgi:hypothetical protein